MRKLKLVILLLCFVSFSTVAEGFNPLAVDEPCPENVDDHDEMCVVTSYSGEANPFGGGAIYMKGRTNFFVLSYSELPEKWDEIVKFIHKQVELNDSSIYVTYHRVHIPDKETDVVSLKIKAVKSGYRKYPHDREKNFQYTI